MRRRGFLGGLGGLGLTAFGRAVPASAGGSEPGSPRLDAPILRLLDPLPAYLADDLKLLVGWVTDVAAVGASLLVGLLVDSRSGFASVPGFAAPTPLDALAGRYRLLRAPPRLNDQFGAILGLLDAEDRVRAVLLVNRLFRLPVLLQEPIGVARDLWTNAGLLLGFRPQSLAAALALAEDAWAEACRLNVPLIAAGQSQAGGMAQLQIAFLARRTAAAGRIGFVTFNATCSAVSVRRLGVDFAKLPGINFVKDRDPLVGPHALLANQIGLQLYVHADGSAGLQPRSSYLAAMFHPREHALDSFDRVSLARALDSIRG